MRAVVYHGDCLDVLAGLADGFVDAVVTDPPYELGFMGRAWDASGIAYNVDLWKHCLRVLRPGGHLLAFGGTRTSHRLTCAIEDAGFEIRDEIAWLYGSGFPKSLDVSKAIDKARNDQGGWVEVTSWLADQAEAAGVTKSQIDAHMGTSDMGGWWLSRLVHRCALPTLEQWDRLRDLIQFGPDMDPEVLRLNLRKGEPGDAWAEREIIDRNERGPGWFTSGDGHDVTAPATDDAKRWAGWGTALKPAHEPIVVARKPLAGTVAANVLAYGTGALNIDATRVSPRGFSENTRGDSSACTCLSREASRTSRTESTSPQASSGVSPADHSDHLASVPAGETGYRQLQDSPDGYRPSLRSDDGHAQSAAKDDRASAQPLLDAHASLDPDVSLAHSLASPSMPCAHCTTGHVEQGRWPTNVVMDEVAAAELDEQSGERPGGNFPQRRTANAIYGGGAGTNLEQKGGARAMGDTGGASRFFPVFRYQAKAPTRERPKVDGVAHPTVKPLDLMRWLVRLVTPVDGIVLEPFAGSGTTLEAAVAEGMRCIGIEQSADYLSLIAERMARAGLVVL